MLMANSPALVGTCMIHGLEGAPQYRTRTLLRTFSKWQIVSGSAQAYAQGLQQILFMDTDYAQGFEHLI